MIFMTSLHRHTGRRIVIYVTWNWNSPQRSLEKTQMEPNGDMVTDSRGGGYVISCFDLRLFCPQSGLRKVTIPWQRQPCRTWVAVTTAAARSERRTVGADTGAEAVGRRFGSARASAADTVAALGSDHGICGLRQLRTSQRRGHLWCLAGRLQFTRIRSRYR